jgi:transcriptional regulator with XRE-family HTH domain
MATRETASARGRRLGTRLQTALLDQIRDARTAAGLSQRTTARHLGWSRSQFWRFENGVVDASLPDLSTAAAICGLVLRTTLHPLGEPVRDAGQQQLIARFRVVLHSAWHVMQEAPFPTLGDLRSWDLLIRLATGFRVGVEVETRIRDIQGLMRRIRQRELHGGVDAILVVLSNSNHNRALVDELRAALGPSYATAPRDLLTALRTGEILPGWGVILL